MELRREVGFYLSFTDEEIFRGVDLPKKVESCPMAPTTADIITTTGIPSATDVPETQLVPKAMPEKKVPQYARWEKVLHPSWQVLATREIPQSPTMPKWRGRAQQITQMIPISLPLYLLKAPSPPASPSPARALALRWLPTPPQGFTTVTVCLKTPEVMEIGQEMPVGTMVIWLVMTPSISSVCSSHVVKDNTMGLVYLDTVTTSIGRVVLGGSDPNEGPVIEDITDQS